MTPISKKEFYQWMTGISFIFFSMHLDLYSDQNPTWNHVVTFILVFGMFMLALKRRNQARREH